MVDQRLEQQSAKHLCDWETPKGYIPSFVPAVINDSGEAEQEGQQ